MKRRRLTPREREALWQGQGGLCSCGCARPLGSGPFDGEHSIPVWLNGDPKPDALMLVECHKFKTAREAGQRAKVKRITGQTRSQWTGTNRHKKRWPKRSMSYRLFDGTPVRGGAR